MNKMTEKILTSCVAVATLFVTLGVVLFSFYLRNIYESPKYGAVEINMGVKENKPSYEYLKSITVEIIGHAVEEEHTYFLPDFGGFPIETEMGEVAWSGTGVVVSVDNNYTYILTNAHVAGKDMKDALIYVNDDGREKLTEIVEIHGTLDLAILKVKGKLKYKEPVKGITTGNPSDKVYIVGHHLGRPYIYGEGVFAGYDGIFDIMQLPCLYGNSGSGIINEDGELIALVFAITNFGFFEVDEAHAICIDGASIKVFLEKLNLI